MSFTISLAVSAITEIYFITNKSPDKVPVQRNRCAQRDLHLLVSRICRPAAPRTGALDRLVAKGVTGTFYGHSPPLRVRIPLEFDKENARTT